MIIKDNKLVIITEPKTINFDFPNDCSNNVKQEIDFIIKRKGFLSVNTIKTRLVDYCPNIGMETIFMNTEDTKTNEPQKFVLNLLQRLDLRGPD